jgi:hypothetical protein
MSLAVACILGGNSSDTLAPGTTDEGLVTRRTTSLPTGPRRRSNDRTAGSLLSGDADTNRWEGPANRLRGQRQARRANGADEHKTKSRQRATIISKEQGKNSTPDVTGRGQRGRTIDWQPYSCPLLASVCCARGVPQPPISSQRSAVRGCRFAAHGIWLDITNSLATAKRP